MNVNNGYNHAKKGDDQKDDSYYSKKLYVSNIQWFESIKHVRSIKDITKELRQTLDKLGLLDAKWYLLRYFVLDDISFIKKHLRGNKVIKYESLTINQIYDLVDIFKREYIHLEENDEDLYAITSYSYKQYKDILGKKGGGDKPPIQPITLVKEFEREKISDYTNIDNTLINLQYSINQTIGNYKILELMKLFKEGGGQSLGEIIEELYNRITSHSYNMDNSIKTYCTGKKNLITFIRKKTGGKVVDLDLLIEFFENCYLLYANIQSIQQTVSNNNKTYQNIKNHINNIISHVLDKESYEFHDAKTKNGERMFDKIIDKYDGNLLDIKDITRCAFVFTDINHLVGGLQRIFRSFHDLFLFNIILKEENGRPLLEIDDKIGLILKRAIKPSGYRDITLVLHFQSETGLVPMEIQLHLKDMYTMKTEGMGGVYSALIKENIITSSEIEYINNILIQKGNSYFLPTSDDDSISSDKVYNIRRLFKEDQNHITDTSFTQAAKNIVDSIVAILGGKRDMSIEEIVDKLGKMESWMNDFAWKKVIDKINLPPKGHAPKEKKEGKALKKEIGDTLKK